MKVADVANDIIKTASTSDLKNLQTLKTVCNSDSAFVAAVKKYQAYHRLLQKAFLLSRTWQKLGQARTWKITVKALQAALKALISGFKRMNDLTELPLLLQKQIDKLIKTNSFQIPHAV
jgi:ATP phosphoribosyltransferase